MIHLKEWYYEKRGSESGGRSSEGGKSRYSGTNMGISSRPCEIWGGPYKVIIQEWQFLLGLEGRGSCDSTWGLQARDHGTVGATIFQGEVSRGRCSGGELRQDGNVHAVGCGEGTVMDCSYHILVRPG